MTGSQVESLGSLDDVTSIFIKNHGCYMCRRSSVSYNKELHLIEWKHTGDYDSVMVFDAYEIQGIQKG